MLQYLYTNIKYTKIIIVYEKIAIGIMDWAFSRRFIRKYAIYMVFIQSQKMSNKLIC